MTTGDEPKDKPVIVHIAVDYDNAHRGRPTKAIQLFIAELDQFQHIVFSLKRTINPLHIRLTRLPDGRNGEEIYDYHYFGLPAGVLLFFSMFLVYRRIASTLSGRNVDIIHAHKFAVEGISAWLLSRHLKKPFVISLRGEVEKKFVRYKPTYRRLYKIIARASAYQYFVSAWYKESFQLAYQTDPALIRLLPNVVVCRAALNASVNRPPEKQLISVINLNDLKRKGFITLLQALAEIKKTKGACPSLDVYGGGTDSAVTAASGLVQKYGLTNEVRLLGAVPSDQLASAYGQYRVFVMPSFNETFGMVYVESLLAGTPIILCQDSGIAGYIDEIDIAGYISYGDSAALAQVIVAMLNSNKYYIENITASYSLIVERLSHKAALAQYQSDVSALVNASQTAPQLEPELCRR